jgi:hypothetical protein
MWLPFWSLLPLLGLVGSSTTDTCDRPPLQLPSQTVTPALAPSVEQPAEISSIARNSGHIRFNTVAEILGILSTVEVAESIYTETRTPLWNSSWVATSTVASRNDVQIAGEPTSERSTTESAKMPIITPLLETDICWASVPCGRALSDLADAYEDTRNITDPNEHNLSTDYGNGAFQIRFCSELHHEK